MLLDIIVAILFVLALFKGFSKGFIVAFFSFVAFFVGLAAALKLSAVAANYLGENTNISQRWLPFVAFIVVFLIVVLLVRIGAKLLEKTASLVMLGWLNKLGGFLLYALLYLFVLSILLFYAEQLNLVKPELAERSITYSFIHALAPKMINAAGVIFPFLKDLFAQLQDFFGKFD